MPTTQHAFGTVDVREHGVSIDATGAQLYAWAHRSGAAWPCSVLADLDEIHAHFDAHGLVDIDHPGVEDLPADEFNAWSSDVLLDALPQDHPAYFVTVGQFFD